MKTLVKPLVKATKAVTKSRAIEVRLAFVVRRRAALA